MEEKKVLLSVKDLDVKFRVRGRTLTAIRGISLDIYEEEAIAIVGESAAGKSVFTKTFAGMLDDNGYIDNGSVIFNDPELSDIWVPYGDAEKSLVEDLHKKLDVSAKLEAGADIYRQILDLKRENEIRGSLTDKEKADFEEKMAELNFRRTEAFNEKQTLDPKKEKARYQAAKKALDTLEKEIDKLEKQKEEFAKKRAHEAKNDAAANAAFSKKLSELEAKYKEACSHEISKETSERDLTLAKEIHLSVGRFGSVKRNKATKKLLEALEKAMQLGVDLTNDEQCNQVFDDVVFRVKLLEEKDGKLHGKAVINLAKLKYSKDWCQIRGKRIATVFQDPMTSLNPIITIGKQISSIILKHQNCSEVEARSRAIDLMKGSYAGLRLMEEMCGNEPYGVHRLGDIREVEHISLQKLNKHYQDTLPRARLELFYCGSAEEKRVIGTFTRAFAALPRQGCIQPAVTEIRHGSDHFREVVEVMDVTQGKLSMGYRTTYKDTAANMVMNVMFGGMNGKLFRYVREKLSLCYYCSSSYHRRKGLLTVSSGIQSSNYEKALAAIESQCRAMQEGEWEPWEFDSAVAYLLNDLRTVEDSAGAMENFAIGQAAAGSDETLYGLMDAIKAVTPEKVMEAARALEPDTIYFLKGKEESHE